MTTRVRIFSTPPPVLLLLLLLLKYSSRYFKDYLHPSNFSVRFPAKWNVYYVRMSHKINVTAHEETDSCFFLICFLFCEKKSQIFARNFFLSLDWCSNYALCWLYGIVKIVKGKFHFSSRKRKHCVCVRVLVTFHHWWAISKRMLLFPSCAGSVSLVVSRWLSSACIVYKKVLGHCISLILSLSLCVHCIRFELCWAFAHAALNTLLCCGAINVKSDFHFHSED